MTMYTNSANFLFERRIPTIPRAGICNLVMRRAEFHEADTAGTRQQKMGALQANKKKLAN